MSRNGEKYNKNHTSCQLEKSLSKFFHKKRLKKIFGNTLECHEMAINAIKKSHNLSTKKNWLVFFSKISLTNIFWKHLRISWNCKKCNKKYKTSWSWAESSSVEFTSNYDLQDPAILKPNKYQHLLAAVELLNMFS